MLECTIFANFFFLTTGDNRNKKKMVLIILDFSYIFAPHS